MSKEIYPWWFNRLCIFIASTGSIWWLTLFEKNWANNALRIELASRWLTKTEINLFLVFIKGANCCS